MDSQVESMVAHVLGIGELTEFLAQEGEPRALRGHGLEEVARVHVRRLDRTT